MYLQREDWSLAQRNCAIALIVATAASSLFLLAATVFSFVVLSLSVVFLSIFNGISAGAFALISVLTLIHLKKGMLPLSPALRVSTQGLAAVHTIIALFAVILSIVWLLHLASFWARAGDSEALLLEVASLYSPAQVADTAIVFGFYILMLFLQIISLISTSLMTKLLHRKSTPSDVPKLLNALLLAGKPEWSDTLDVGEGASLVTLGRDTKLNQLSLVFDLNSTCDKNHTKTGKSLPDTEQTKRSKKSPIFFAPDAWFGREYSSPGGGNTLSSVSPYRGGRKIGDFLGNLFNNKPSPSHGGSIPWSSSMNSAQMDPSEHSARPSIFASVLEWGALITSRGTLYTKDDDDDDDDIEVVSPKVETTRSLPLESHRNLSDTDPPPTYVRAATQRRPAGFFSTPESEEDNHRYYRRETVPALTRGRFDVTDFAVVHADSNVIVHATPKNSKLDTAPDVSVIWSEYCRCHNPSFCSSDSSNSSDTTKSSDSIDATFDIPDSAPVPRPLSAVPRISFGFLQNRLPSNDEEDCRWSPEACSALGSTRSLTSSAQGSSHEEEEKPHSSDDSPINSPGVKFFPARVWNHVRPPPKWSPNANGRPPFRE